MTFSGSEKNEVDCEDVEECVVNKQDMITPTLKRLQRNDKILVDLTFRFVKLNSAELESLRSSLGSNTNLRKLKIYKCDIHGEGSKVVASIIEDNSGIKELVLYQNLFREEDSVVIGNALARNSSITSFSVYKNQIGCQGMTAIADSILMNNTITELNLFKNNIGIDGIYAIMDLLKEGSSIKSLSLNYNDAGDFCAEAISKHLRNNTSLLRLALSGAKISQLGALAVADILTSNSTLQKLDLSCNNLGDQGSMVIAQALAHSNSTLTDLDLSSNSLSNEGLKSVLETLGSNLHLTTLKLKQENNNLEEEVISFMTRNQMIKNHQQGVQNFGPFFYISIHPHKNMIQGIKGDMETTILEWLPTAWEVFSLDGSIIALLHQCLVTVKQLIWNDDDGNDESYMLAQSQTKEKFESVLQSYQRNKAMKSQQISSNMSLESLTREDFQNLIENSCDDNGSNIVEKAALHNSEEAFNLKKFLIDSLIQSLSDDRLNSTHASISSKIQGNNNLFFGRYDIKNWPDTPIHRSPISTVYSAIDLEVVPSDKHRHVAIKIFNDKKDFDRYLNQHMNLGEQVLNNENLYYIDADDQWINKNKFDAQHLLPLLRFHEEELCFVMPLADRNLHDIICGSDIAGKDLPQIRSIMKDVALSLHYLHEKHEMIHGNIKPRNFVSFNGEIKMIDVGEATKFNQPLKLSKSNGFIAPELAKDLFHFKDSPQDVHYWEDEKKKVFKNLLSLDRIKSKDNEDFLFLGERLEEINYQIKLKKHLKCQSILSPSHFEPSVAQPSIDIWSYGVLAYYLLSGSSLFIMDQNDNLYPSDMDEQQKLVTWKGLNDTNVKRILQSSHMKEKRLEAIDLLKRCLHPDSRLRLSNMNQVLNHQFFTNIPPANISTANDNIEGIQSDYLNESKGNKSGPYFTISFCRRGSRNSYAFGDENCASIVSSIPEVDLDIDTRKNAFANFLSFKADRF